VFFLAIVAGALANWFMLTIVFSIWFALTQNRATSAASYASWWALLLMGCCAGLALTPIGEAFFRLLHGCRRPTRGEEMKLRPLFEEICRAAQVSPDRYDIRVSDDSFPNAFAVGNRTICLTRSLLNGFDDETVLGVIAHEVGHHVHGDAVRSIIFFMITLVGQIIMWGGWLVAKFLQLFTVIGGYGRNRQFEGGAAIFSIFSALVWALMWVFQIFVWVPIYIGAYFGIRRSEYSADRYAAEIGYSEGLLSFLNQIVDLDGSPSGFMGLLYRTHPKTGERIRRLEDLEEDDSLSNPSVFRAPIDNGRPWKIAIAACASACVLALGWTAFPSRGEPEKVPIVSRNAGKTTKPPPPAPKKPSAVKLNPPVAKTSAANPKSPETAQATKPAPRPLPDKSEQAIYVNTGIRTDRARGKGYYERWFDGLYGKGSFRKYLDTYYQNNYKAGKEISARPQ
jgi:heat shock protein HtpX